MILAALEINWLSISIDLLLVIFVLICVVMTFLILMQRPKQEGLGAAFGGGVTDQVFGARTTNVLQRGTVHRARHPFGTEPAVGGRRIDHHRRRLHGRNRGCHPALRKPARLLAQRERQGPKRRA